MSEILDIGEQWLLAVGYFGTQAFVALGGIQQLLG